MVQVYYPRRLPAETEVAVVRSAKRVMMLSFPDVIAKAH
jgi:hypothetical protein